MNRAEYTVSMMCRVLGVSSGGYYSWRKRGVSKRGQEDRYLCSRIGEHHADSKGTYGTPRIHAQLRAEGIFVGRKRVARLMKKLELKGVSRRRWPATTTRDNTARSAPDLVQRDFTADAPNRLWVADITYVPTRSTGFLYLAVVIDAFNREVVGWAMKIHLTTELVLAALQMAITSRRPEQVVHHSDQGCQYTSIAFGSRCARDGVRPSMGSVGDCYDNALCESFFATLECELLDRTRFQDAEEAARAIFEFIEGWYNPRRLHSALGYQSPHQFERNYYQRQALTTYELSTKPG